MVATGMVLKHLLPLKVAQGTATSLCPARCPQGGVCPRSALESH